MQTIDRTRTDVEPSGPLAAADQRTELWVIGPDVHHRMLLESGTVTLGRAEECTIRLDHTSVSRQHLTLFIGREIHVEDVGSRNGTLFNGQKLQHTVRTIFTPRDVLEIGPFRLLLQPVAAPAPNDTPVIESEPMKRTYAQAEQVARGSISVLVLGETGVGKDVLALRIHHWSSRSVGPFVRFNCAAVTESLLESELFGHTRGAFTGAVSAREGLIEAANNGTLFLDEVGELSPGLQAKLLHVIETREVTRVGSSEPTRVDVRFVAATHRRLDTESTFRRDLYYRLAGAVLEVPPLRERPDDVLALAERFLVTVAKGLNRPVPVMTAAAIEALRAHPWPGNVRELRNVIEHAVLTHGSTIDGFSFGPHAAPKPVEVTPNVAVFQLTHDELSDRARIIEALDACAGNQTRAAKMLGWSRSTLAAKLVTYRIPRPRA